MRGLSLGHNGTVTLHSSVLFIFAAARGCRLFGRLVLLVDFGRKQLLIVDTEPVPFQLGRDAIPNVGHVNHDGFDAGAHGPALVGGFLAAVVELDELKPLGALRQVNASQRLGRAYSRPNEDARVFVRVWSVQALAPWSSNRHGFTLASGTDQEVDQTGRVNARLVILVQVFAEGDALFEHLFDFRHREEHDLG
uniref:Uncharacterized protein n=1 Tax=Cacopsylla melanoneura TaxID=428564 RepID=A0A8D8QGT7_9HEMI